MSPLDLNAFDQSLFRKCYSKFIFDKLDSCNHLFTIIQVSAYCK